MRSAVSRPWPSHLTKDDFLSAEVMLPLMNRGELPDLASLAQVWVREPYQAVPRLLVVDVSRLPAP